jgi:hypothetical protein
LGDWPVVARTDSNPISRVEQGCVQHDPTRKGRQGGDKQAVDGAVAAR